MNGTRYQQHQEPAPECQDADDGLRISLTDLNHLPGKSGEHPERPGKPIKVIDVCSAMKRPASSISTIR